MTPAAQSVTPSSGPRRRRTLIVLLPLIGVACWVGWSWSRAIQIEEAAIRELVGRGYAVTVDPSYGKSLRAPYPARWFCGLIGRSNFRNAIEVSSTLPVADSDQPYAADAPTVTFFTRPARGPLSNDLNGIGRLPRLQRLTLEHLQPSPGGLGVGRAFEALKYCRQLDELTARETDFRDAGGLPFLRHWSHLTRLDLAGSHVDSRGLADIIQHCPHLEVLNLSHTQIDDAGLQRIYRLDKLTHLDLSGTGVGDRGVASLRNPRLRVLNLDQTQVTAAAAQAWSERLRGD